MSGRVRVLKGMNGKRPYRHSALCLAECRNVVADSSLTCAAQRVAPLSARIRVLRAPTAPARSWTRSGAVCGAVLGMTACADCRPAQENYTSDLADRLASWLHGPWCLGHVRAGRCLQCRAAASAGGDGSTRQVRLRR